MKRFLVASLFALAASATLAQPFGFQRQLGASEYVPGADSAHMTFAEVMPSGQVPSLTALMLQANVDGIAPNRFEGNVIETGPTRISLYEVQRGSPEGTANRSYYDLYPVGTDWTRVASDWRADHLTDGLGAGSRVDHGDS